MLQLEAGYIDARPLTANSSKSSCYARPDHTFGSKADMLSNQCPLYPRKRTLELSREMSALCHKRIPALQQLTVIAPDPRDVVVMSCWGQIQLFDDVRRTDPFEGLHRITS